jgi:hypothetical protein
LGFRSPLDNFFTIFSSLMKLYKLGIFLLLLCSTITVFAQDNNNAVVFHIYSTHTSFPDIHRLNGHKSDTVFYNTSEHYRDSTVLIIAPRNLDAKKKVDMIFWFHGWHNNVDNAASYYQLTRQFMESKLNAVLVLPEAAKNSADSYGGKLENPGVFKALVGDVLTGLKDKGMIGADCKPGHILIGGHSGGGEVMSFIVEKGGIDINEAVLFDALYDGKEKFITWINADTSHRFIHLYTDFGYGPKDQSKLMVQQLQQQNIPYFETEESNLTPLEIHQNRLLYIHTLHQHNDIIFNPDNFRLLFENSPFLKKLKD